MWPCVPKNFQLDWLLEFLIFKKNKLRQFWSDAKHSTSPRAYYNGNLQPHNSFKIIFSSFMTNFSKFLLIFYCGRILKKKTKVKQKCYWYRTNYIVHFDKTDFFERKTQYCRKYAWKFCGWFSSQFCLHFDWNVFTFVFICLFSPACLAETIRAFFVFKL